MSVWVPIVGAASLAFGIFLGYEAAIRFEMSSSVCADKTITEIVECVDKDGWFFDERGCNVLLDEGEKHFVQAPRKGQKIRYCINVPKRCKDFKP